MNIRELGKLRARQVTGVLTVGGIISATIAGVAIWAAGTPGSATVSGAATTGSPRSGGGTSSSTGLFGSVQPGTGSSGIAKSSGS